MGRFAWVAATAVGLTAIAVAWFSRPSTPTKVVFTGSKVRALTEDGQLAWSYQLPYQIAEPLEETRAGLISDLNGDGRTEVIVRVRPDPPALGFRDLYCLTERGKLLWTYHPKTVLRFAGTSFDGPRDIRDMILVSEAKGRSVWVATAHHPGWPGFVVSLDGKGIERLRFVNTGQLTSLLEITNKLGRFVLVAGVSNDFREAILAVIDTSSPARQSPPPPPLT